MNRSMWKSINVVNCCHNAVSAVGRFRKIVLKWRTLNCIKQLKQKMCYFVRINKQSETTLICIHSTEIWHYLQKEEARDATCHQKEAIQKVYQDSCSQTSITNLQFSVPLSFSCQCILWMQSSSGQKDMILVRRLEISVKKQNKQSHALGECAILFLIPSSGVNFVRSW